MKPRTVWILAVVAAVALGVGIAMLAKDRPGDAPTPMPELVGHTLDAVTALFGPPVSRDTFKRSEILPVSFYRPLLGVPPPAGDTDPEYLEVRWDRGRNWQAVWFQQENGVWRAIDGLRWGKDVEF